MTPYLVTACQALLAAVFLTSAVSKLRNRGAFGRFTDTIRQLGLVPAAWVRPVAVAVAATEVAIPPLLGLPWTVAGGFGLALGLLTGLTGAIVLGLLQGTRAPCACFGASATPLGVRHVVRNALLVAVATTGLVGELADQAGGHLAGTVVALAAGLVAGGLVTVADDLVDLFLVPSTSGTGRNPGR